jgi:hypothetical protein
MRSYAHWILTGLLAVGLLTGCGGDSDNNPKGSNDQGAELSRLQLTVPSALQDNDNPGALTATSFISSFNAMIEGFRGFLTPPSGSMKEGGPRLATDDVWTWTEGNMTWVLSYQETGSNHQWSLTVNGETLMDAYELKDGSYGYLNMYDLDANERIFRWQWQTGPGNAVSYLMESVGIKLTVDINGDGSGSMDYYVDGVLDFECSWTATGSGSWYDYSSEEGGSWG